MSLEFFAKYWRHKITGVQLLKPLSFFFFCLLFTFSPSVFAIDVVKFVQSTKYPDPKDRYFVDLLTLALDSTVAEYGEFELQPVSVEMAQERTSLMVDIGNMINLTWRMTTPELENKLEPIYVPLLKGIMGHRIFIIRKGEQSSFPSDLSLEQLKKIPVGQGYNWADGKILTHHGFELVEGYDIYLLKMLAKKRFDYFPRALHEPWTEIEANGEFVVEKNLMLKYPSPIYYFVSKKSPRLANRLKKGMNNILVTGAFEEFFKNHPITSEVLKKVNLEQRTTFEFTNPLMTPETKTLISDRRLWLEIN